MDLKELHMKQRFNLITLKHMNNTLNQNQKRKQQVELWD
jgi:hypothetical protein